MNRFKRDEQPARLLPVWLAAWLLLLPGVAARAQSPHPVLVSFNGAGTGSANGRSGEFGDFSISADGRYVAFASEAGNIALNDTNGATDVFVRDLLTGTTELASVTPSGTTGNRSSRSAVISGNGRYVVFTSFAEDLLPNVIRSIPNVFVRDLLTDTTRLVSFDRTNTRSGFGSSDTPFAITPDGRYVVFTSSATDLTDIPPSISPIRQVYLRDMQTNTTRLVSVNRTGAAWADFSAHAAAVTPDGRYVTFNSTASDITDNDANGSEADVFVRDMQTNKTTLVSVNRAGVSANGGSSGGAMSADGRFVFFASGAADVTATPDDNEMGDYFVRDMQAGTTSLISVNRFGNATGNRTNNPNGFFPHFAITPDGRTVAFVSQSSDLVDNDTNASNDDVFLRDLQAGTTRLVSVGLSGRSANFGGSRPSISADGRRVAFESLSTDIVNVPDFVGGLTADVFVRDMEAGVTVLGSINRDGTVTGNNSAFAPRISADGQRVAFHSHASNLVLDDNNGPSGQDVFAFTPFAPAGQLQFSAGSFNVGEADGSATITVTRTGDASATASVVYATSGGTASDRSDYSAAFGTLRFAAGETSKTFNVFVTDDAFVEGDETVTLTLSGAQGVALGAPATATLTIQSGDVSPPTPANNPIGDANFFVRQHYVDFLNREPDSAGLAFWTGQITSCGADAACVADRRVNVSAAFFISIEFQQTGYLVYRAHDAAFDLGPTLRRQDFLADTRAVGAGVIIGQPGAEQLLEANKAAFFDAFVQRQAFTNRYPLSLSAAQFVDALNANTADPLNPSAGGSLTQAERDQLVTALASNTTTRAAVLRRVAEDSDFVRREYNRAFVLLQYFGYLQRNPNDAPEPTLDFQGYNFWLAKLNQFSLPGEDVNDDRVALNRVRRAEMVKAFIISGEYRERFGRP